MEAHQSSKLIEEVRILYGLLQGDKMSEVLEVAAYYCEQCKSVVTNESCIVWKKRSKKDIATFPYCWKCDNVVERRFHKKDV